MSYNLDEYVGLAPGHPCSYHAFMMEQLFDHVNMRREAIHVPSGNVADLASAARDYDAAIEAAGGIDIQLLGIGRNGHIGFNEPGECFIDNCHLVTLSQSTIEANTRFFHSVDEVPRQAVSLGIGAIMRARQVVLIATGPDKAQAIMILCWRTLPRRCLAPFFGIIPMRFSCWTAKRRRCCKRGRRPWQCNMPRPV